MMFEYDFDRLNTFLRSVIERNISAEAWNWLVKEGKDAHAKGGISRFNIAFVAMPRKTGKQVLSLSGQEEVELRDIRKDLTIKGWTADRLCRVWLLMQLNPRDQEAYIAAIENLFLNAEMSELVALYSSLPLLAYPESWRKRCAEGIRNNIGPVLESVMCNNPYPAEHLDEAAWNQMVLKAIFTEKPILHITGLEKRMNMNLALALGDYAHERWAAHRQVNPLLWICVRPFVSDNNFNDIQRLFSSDDPAERQAAALVCYKSAYEPARQLLERNGQLKSSIENRKLTWSSIVANVSEG